MVQIVTSNRIRKHPGYEQGRDIADGLTITGALWIHTSDGEKPVRAGYADRMQEIADQERINQLNSEDLTVLLHQARYDQDFDKLCAIVERLIEGVGK